MSSKNPSDNNRPRRPPRRPVTQNQAQATATSNAQQPRAELSFFYGDNEAFPTLQTASSISNKV